MTALACRDHPDERLTAKGTGCRQCARDRRHHVSTRRPKTRERWDNIEAGVVTEWDVPLW